MIIQSIILTLICMLLCHIFQLGLFGSIFLMICVFTIINYRGRIKVYLYNRVRVFSFFERKRQKVEIKSSYERMDLDD